MHKSQTIKNAICSILQIILSAIVLFVLYRYMLNALGAELLGIWSLVLATTSISRISEIGFSGSSLKFVAKYLARGEMEQVVSVMQTSIISVAVIIGFVTLAGYPVLKWGLKLAISQAELGLGQSLLPYALISLWLSSMAGVAGAGLEGCLRFDVRAYIQMAAHVLYLVSAIWLIPSFGLYGVAFAQLLQATFTMLVSWFTLRHYLPGLPFIPCRWSSSNFKEMLYYGINFQITSIARLIYDPVTKALISRFGGLELTGYYEMASRMVLQLRSLLVRVNRVLIPVFADLIETKPKRIVDIYNKSYRLLFYCSFPLYGAIMAAIPLISEVWIGYYESNFVFFSLFLTAGWALNNLSVPAYMANLGSGRLIWNTVGHIAIGLFNVGFGFLLGFHMGGMGVVIGWVISLVIGSAIIVFFYHFDQDIPIRFLWPKDSRLLTLAVVLGVILSLLTCRFFYAIDFSIGYLIGGPLVYSIMLLYPTWSHPLREKILGMILPFSKVVYKDVS